MWTTVISVLTAIGQPLWKIITETMFPFVKKHWKIVMPVCVLLIVFGYMFWMIKERNDEIVKWKNEAAKAKGLEQVARNTYEAQAIESKKISIDNKELKKRLDDTKRDVLYYMHTLLVYKTRLDSIHTVKPDTLYVDNTGPRDTTDRVFNYKYKDDLVLAGWFQTREPFLLNVSLLKLLFNIDIAVSQDKEGTWFTDINTNSDLLSPSSIKVFIKPLPERYEYFYGLHLNYMGGINGIGSIGGVKKGSWGGYLGVDLLSGNDIYFKIGIIKFGVLL